MSDIPEKPTAEFLGRVALKVAGVKETFETMDEYFKRAGLALENLAMTLSDEELDIWYEDLESDDE